MRKIIFSLITVIIASALVLAGCDKDKNKGGVSVPPPAVVSGPQTNDCGSSDIPTITLTAVSNTAVTFEWQYGDSVIAGQTGSTLVLQKTDSVYPDVRLIRARGINAVGSRGLLGEDYRVEFLPCGAPGKAVITGYDTICHEVSTTLLATCENAVSYKWYRDGREIIGANGRSRVVEDAGVYTVKGFNRGEEGEESAPFTVVASDDCVGQVVPNEGITGYWTVEGYEYFETRGDLGYPAPFDNRPLIQWEDTIAMYDVEQGLSISNNFAGAGYPIIFNEDANGYHFYSDRVIIDSTYTEVDPYGMVQVVGGLQIDSITGEPVTTVGSGGERIQELAVFGEGNLDLVFFNGGRSFGLDNIQGVDAKGNSTGLFMPVMIIFTHKLVDKNEQGQPARGLRQIVVNPVYTSSGMVNVSAQKAKFSSTPKRLKQTSTHYITVKK
ncbi:MAG: hypothetical protein LBU91_03520 [Bacteroidales bacterium]|jgi:hypothetical protein|nr:hypothetical protein [Bacteroidales bacterium]